MTNVLVIDGHPDKGPTLCHALAEAYVEGARQAGHETRLIRLADANFPLLRRAADFTTPPDDPTIQEARSDILWASHVVFVFPLWLGGAPSLLRGFLEQCARGQFFAEMSPTGPRGRLKGKSARMIVTMGAPSLFYRLVYGAFGLRAIARSVLGFAGLNPVRSTLFGAIEGPQEAQKRRIARVRDLGVSAA
ncbi:NAD(P)H-dependent oxidoreductase [Vitreimonas sp.]|uniref:NAD(P)H-dependent oxidoreductase n=1 Tax=Vitreimonas sp. TaxID=3069702 RepID=UPI002ED83E5F